jgi:hypothetical protein
LSKKRKKSEESSKKRETEKCDSLTRPVSVSGEEGKRGRRRDGKKK